MGIQGYLKKHIKSETKKVLDRMLLDLICKACLPFNILESEISKKFVYTLNPNCIMSTPKSLSNVLLATVRNQEFEKSKETSHYMDENCKLNSILIENSELKNKNS